MRRTVQQGSIGQAWWVCAESDQPGPARPAPRLLADLPRARAAFIRSDSGTPRPIALRPCSLDQPVAGGLAEGDPQRLPGVYRFWPPDEIFAPGATGAVVVLLLPGARPIVIEVDLVAYDSRDGHGLALGGFSRTVRHEHLTGIFRSLAPEAVRAAAVRAQSTRNSPGSAREATS